MPTTPKVGDEQTPAGAGGEPKPPVSQEPAKSIEGNAANLSEILDAALDRKLKPVIKEVRGLQGRQDKAEERQTEFLEEFKKKKEAGLSDEEAAKAASKAVTQRAEADEDKLMLREIHAKLFGSPSTGPAGTREGEAVDADKAIETIIATEKLDYDSPRVLNIVANPELTPEAKELALRREAARIRTQQPASVASAPVLQDGVPPPPAPKVDPRIARLAELQQHPSANRVEIKRLQEEMDKEGWPE